jgi:hypothetical protein
MQAVAAQPMLLPGAVRIARRAARDCRSNDIKASLRPSHIYAKGGECAHE